MKRRPPISTQSRSSAASDVYKRQDRRQLTLFDDAAFGPDAQLRIPPYLCGSPKFVVVKVNSDELSILKGAVLVENETDTVLPDNLYKLSLIHISEPTRPY